jgi:hypothetical protein
MSDEEESVLIGLDSNCVPDLESFLDQANQASFDFVTVPLVHPRFRRNLTLNKEERDWALTRSDLTFNSSTWSSQIVGKISPWIDLESANSTVRRNSELVSLLAVPIRRFLTLSIVGFQARSCMGHSPFSYAAVFLLCSCYSFFSSCFL